MKKENIIIFCSVYVLVAVLSYVFNFNCRFKFYLFF